MTTPTQWHNESMATLDLALEARKQREHAKAQEHFVKALALETKAATHARTQPSRCILFRSAAWIAIEAGLPEEAERLAASGLADHDVPVGVKQELRAVAEEARMRIFKPLAPPSAASVITLHMEGPAIAHGRTKPSLLTTKQAAFISLITRTAERKNNEKFRTHGSSTFASELDLQVEYQAASVAILVTLGGAQMELWDKSADIADELLTCLRLANENRTAEVKKRISNEKYFENFYGLVTQLAPDEKQITSVDVLGATSTRKLAPVRFRKRPVELPASTTETSIIEIEGELRGADETGKKNTITLLPESSDLKKVTIEVTDAVMEDLVRPLYGRLVRVRARQITNNRGKTRYTMHGTPEALD